MANDQDLVFEWVLHAMYDTIKRGLTDALQIGANRRKLQETTIFCHKPRAPFAS